MKKILVLLGLSFLLLGSCPAENDSVSGAQKDYGVFVGIAPANIKTLFNYRMVIIDAENFTSAQIKTLRDKDIQVYSYLNMGAIEEDREYKDPDNTDRKSEFLGKKLKKYEGWDKEWWMDMSYTPWQDFLAYTQGKRLAEKGINGFFLDNADVYVYNDLPHEDIYQGLLASLEKLGAQGLPMIINGGLEFVKRALEEGKLSSQVKGINQECVFTTVTSYNGSGTFGTQDQNDRKAYQESLGLYKKSGLQVYLTEYSKNSSGTVVDEIAKYCQENKFLYFIAPSLILDK